MKYLIGLIMAALLLSTLGCGHKKGVIPASLSSGQHTREMVVGDKMVYDVTVSGTTPSGKTASPAEGTITDEVKAPFKHGPIPSNIKKTFHVDETMEVNGSSTGQISWVGQDADGAIYSLGRLDQGTAWALVKDKDIKPDTPAVLTGGASLGYTVHLSDGKTETDKYTIEKTEKIKTPAGDFEAYKTKAETKISDGRLAKGYIWFRPELARPIKVELDLSNTLIKNKSNTHVDQELKSYKLAE